MYVVGKPTQIDLWSDNIIGFGKYKIEVYTKRIISEQNPSPKG